MKKILALLFCISLLTSFSFAYKFPVNSFYTSHPDIYSSLERSVSKHIEQFLCKSELTFNQLEAMLNIQYAAVQLSKNDLEALYKATKIITLTTKENLFDSIDLSILKKKIKRQKKLLKQLDKAQLAWDHCISYLDNNTVVAEFFTEMAQYRINQIEQYLQTINTEIETRIKETTHSFKSNIEQIIIANRIMETYLQQESNNEKLHATSRSQVLDLINRISQSINMNSQEIVKCSHYFQVIIAYNIYEFSATIDFLYYEKLYELAESRFPSQEPRIVDTSELLLLPNPDILFA